jgi:hypothetical protein
MPISIDKKREGGAASNPEEMLIEIQDKNLRE